MSASPNKAFVAVLAAAAILSGARDALAQDAPIFVGTWTLNAEKTEPVKDRVIGDPEGTGTDVSTGLGRRGASRRPPEVAGGSGRRSGGGGGGGARGGGRGTFRLIFGGMMSPSNTLKILQADSILTIDDEEGPVFVNLRTDNKVLEEKMTNQTVLKTKVQWRKNELVVERNHDSEGSARMIMRIDPRNPKTMIVDFHYEHKRQRRTIDQRRIYEAAM